MQRYAIHVLVAAALFGASAPVAKLLLERMTPVVLAALAYCGGGLALGIAWLVRRARAPRATRGGGTRWTRLEVWSLAGAVVAGGIVAPTVLFASLAHMPASSASLLLTFEGLLTAIFAALIFHEAVDRRIWLAMLIMLVAGGLLSSSGGRFGLQVVPAAGVIAACALWAVDNNLTRAVSHRDALAIAALKCLIAGLTNAAISPALTRDLQVSVLSVFGALTLGALSYGLSLLLFVSALAHLGSARTAAHFGTAPFFGAALALWLGEPLTASLAIAIGLTAVSTWLVLTERHEHLHIHEALEHEHLHWHDQHHRHAHRGNEGPEPHTHWHRHEPLTHWHAHLPDLHHRHEH
jgi:drug/metabolite transporter (DMT)-like permease